MRPPSLKAADFQKALGARPVSRTAHFVLHALPRPAGGDAHAADVVAQAASGPAPASAAELSTSDIPAEERLVDDFVLSLPGSPSGVPAPSSKEGCSAGTVWRLGLVLPKKQAKRSVTRNLIRHQAREALRRHAPAMQATGRHDVDGWVVRLRAPFDRQQFPSAASDALKAAVRQELDELWGRMSSAKPSRQPGSQSISGVHPARSPGGAA